MPNRFLIVGLLCVVLCSLAGCPGKGSSPAPTPGLASEWEMLCVDRGKASLGDAAAIAMCRCVAGNHRLHLSQDEFQLLLRDYRGEFDDAFRASNNDLNQLIVHDAMVVEACLEDPAFQVPTRSQWRHGDTLETAAAGRLPGSRVAPTE